MDLQVIWRKHLEITAISHLTSQYGITLLCMWNISHREMSWIKFSCVHKMHISSTKLPDFKKIYSKITVLIMCMLSNTFSKLQWFLCHVTDSIQCMALSLNQSLLFNYIPKVAFSYCCWTFMIWLYTEHFLVFC